MLSRGCSQPPGGNVPPPQLASKQETHAPEVRRTNRPNEIGDDGSVHIAVRGIPATNDFDAFKGRVFGEAIARCTYV